MAALTESKSAELSMLLARFCSLGSATGEGSWMDRPPLCSFPRCCCCLIDYYRLSVSSFAWLSGPHYYYWKLGKHIVHKSGNAFGSVHMVSHGVSANRSSGSSQKNNGSRGGRNRCLDIPSWINPALPPNSRFRGCRVPFRFWARKNKITTRHSQTQKLKSKSHCCWEILCERHVRQHSGVPRHSTRIVLIDAGCDPATNSLQPWQPGLFEIVELLKPQLQLKHVETEVSYGILRDPMVSYGLPVLKFSGESSYAVHTIFQTKLQ